MKLQINTATISGPMSIDIPDQYLQEITRPKYLLSYVRLDGDTNDYVITSILSLDSKLLKATVAGKGYRSFKSNRILSLMPLINQ